MKFKKLSKFLPGFLHKPGKPESKPVLTVAVLQSKPAPVPEPESVKPTKPQKMLDDLCAFLARYLQCSQDQRTVLALWILHTWCFSAARSSPYLAIQSSRKLSGKTLCLRLLSLLCCNPALTSGYTASALVKRIHSNPKELPTFLLDESPATLGSRGRSKNPKLRAILVSGFQPGIGYSDRSVECTIYSPKAFASTGPLPEPLADCSIPIVLQPWNARVAQPPSAVSSVSSAASDEIERLDLITAQQQARLLITALQKWSEKNLSTLKSLPAYKRKDFPERLTPRGQDIVEPLLHLADAVGGDYPARARQALVAMFDDENDADRATRIQLLRDIRQCFEHHGWPDKLHTSVILSWLHALPPRPWDVDGPITDRTLARFLRPHGIRSRLVRVGSVARGYKKDDFATPWNFLLDNAGKTSEPKQSSSQPVTSTARVASPPSLVTQTRVAQPPGSPTRAGVARDGVEVPPAVPSVSSVATSNASLAMSSGSQPPATPTPQSKIPNNDAPCNTVTDVKIDPRIKGILADPRNYHRQYPESHKQGTRDIIVNRHHWPQPADDKGRPNMIYPLESGIEIPYTIVNRNPADPESSGGYRNHTERWPVTLSDDEKTQVATARFFEIYLAALAAREKKQNEAAGNREKVSWAVS